MKLAISGTVLLAIAGALVPTISALSSDVGDDPELRDYLDVYLESRYYDGFSSRSLDLPERKINVDFVLATNGNTTSTTLKFPGFWEIGEDSFEHVRKKAKDFLYNESVFAGIVKQANVNLVFSCGMNSCDNTDIDKLTHGIGVTVTVQFPDATAPAST